MTPGHERGGRENVRRFVGISPIAGHPLQHGLEVPVRLDKILEVLRREIEPGCTRQESASEMQIATAAARRVRDCRTAARPRSRKTGPAVPM